MHPQQCLVPCVLVLSGASVLQAGSSEGCVQCLSVYQPTVADWRIAMQVESALGPALQAAYAVMQDYGGKMLVFQNAVPSLGELLNYTHVICAKSHRTLKPTRLEPLIVPDLLRALFCLPPSL